MTEIKIHPGWKAVMDGELGKPYFQILSQFIQNEVLSGKTIYPDTKNIFAAFDVTPFRAVKVVIL
jgi:uracil-DNA glycosylase